MQVAIENVYSDIRKKGKKLTLTRRAIIEMLLSSHTLLSAPEIQGKLEDLGISVNKTSVYRELQFLLNHKIIQEVSLKSGVTHYESALLPHHHHVTCTSCGESKDIDTKSLDDSLGKLEKEITSQGFSVSEHSLEFYGLCPKCK